MARRFDDDSLFPTLNTLALLFYSAEAPLNHATIKAIFWDNDGVLVDTEQLYFEATRQVLSDLGVSLSVEQFTEFMLVQGKGAWHLAFERGVPEERLDELRRRRDGLYADLLTHRSRVILGVPEVLETLHGRYRMAVVTSSRRVHFDIIHRRSGLLPYFDFVITGEDSPTHKPDPGPYLLATARSGFRSEECVAIEDSQRGLIAAKRAGIGCFIIPTDLTRNGDFRAADKVLRSASQIPEALMPESHDRRESS
ncbi:MAG TPA: HAD-IA family hydrolase [Bacteroidota bacterium]|nr:HAD-IA family hydrolase [Bacteroidota bacterium]